MNSGQKSRHSTQSGVSEDLERVERARNGDARAYEELIGEYRLAALRRARSLTGSEDDAEDAVQEATIKAWRAMPTFRPGAAFKPWLMAIVANEAHSRGREAKRRGNLARRAEAEATALPPPTEVDSPEARLLAEEQAREVQAAAESLPQRDRDVIRMRYQEDLSEAEMAEELDCAPGTVKSRLARARRRLREHLVMALLLALLITGATAIAVPPVRAALERLLGIAGSVKVVAVPELPAETADAPFDWGPEVRLDEARERAGFPFPAPRIDGREPRVRFTPDVGDGAVSLIYGASTVTLFRDRGPLALAKFVPPAARVRTLELGGRTALWITGADHALARLNRDGVDPGPPTRIGDSVLAWSGGEGLSYRLQTRLPRAEAVLISADFLDP